VIYLHKDSYQNW